MEGSSGLGSNCFPRKPYLGRRISALAALLRVAQAQLGHSHMSTTLEVYTHASATAQRQAIDQLENQLFPNVPESGEVERIG